MDRLGQVFEVAVKDFSGALICLVNSNFFTLRKFLPKIIYLW